MTIDIMPFLIVENLGMGWANFWSISNMFRIQTLPEGDRLSARRIRQREGSSILTLSPLSGACSSIPRSDWALGWTDFDVCNRDILTVRI